MNKLRLAAALALTGLACSVPQTYACELHEGMGMSGFSLQHPLMQRHFKAARFAVLELNVEDASDVAVNALKKMAVTYKAPAAFQQINVTISGSDAIEFASSTDMVMDKLAGEYQLNYKVRRPGDHTITFVVEAKRDGSPVMIERTARIKST